MPKWFPRAIAYGFAALAMLVPLGGCPGDAFVPVEQGVRVGVMDRENRSALAHARVYARYDPLGGAEKLAGADEKLPQTWPETDAAGRAILRFDSHEIVGGFWPFANVRFLSPPEPWVNGKQYRFTVKYGQSLDQLDITMRGNTEAIGEHVIVCVEKIETPKWK